LRVSEGFSPTVLRVGEGRSSRRASRWEARRGQLDHAAGTVAVRETISEKGDSFGVGTITVRFPAPS
jgi:hypothetical protein